MNPRRELIRGAAGAVVAAGLLGWVGLTGAADYCCQCKGQEAAKSISAPNRAVAVGQCSVECGAFTSVASGKCAAPPAAATPTPATTTPAPASSSVVLVFRSADCSGDPIRVNSSSSRLAEAEVWSFQVESGNSASAWEKTDYAGRGTAPVGPSICVSPGFRILSIQFQ
jgi:hypothetical protein